MNKRDFKTAEMVTPTPYYKISIGGSNRAFYDEKSHLYNIAEEVGIEVQDGYIGEKCDYEGDLEKIIIYRQKRAEGFIDAVLISYGIDVKQVPENVSIHISIY